MTVQLTAKVDSMYWIHDPDGVVRDVVRQKITVQPKKRQNYGFGEKQPLCLLIEDGEWIGLPRAYGIAQYGLEIAEDLRTDGEPITFGLKSGGDGKLIQLQADWVESATNALRSSEMASGIAVAPTGAGKTKLGYDLIHRLGRTALVVVHKVFHIEQWIEEQAPLWTDLTPDDFGIVQGPKCDFEGKKICIAMVESLVSGRKYPPEFYRWAGMLYLDEVNRLGAAKWSEALQQFTARYRVGVSATPGRADGFTDVITHHIGPIVTKMDAWSVPAKVYRYAFPTMIRPHMYSYGQYNEDGEWEKSSDNLSKLYGAISKLEGYNRWLAKEIVKAASADRNVLVFSNRRDHLETLRRYVEEIDATVPGAFFWGGLKKSEREEAKTARVMYCTYQYAKDAMNVPRLDLVFLAMPVANPTQPLGRVLRLSPGKKKPIIVDPVHVDIDICEGFAWKRLSIYKKAGYEIKNFGKWKKKEGRKGREKRHFARKRD